MNGHLFGLVWREKTGTALTKRHVVIAWEGTINRVFWEGFADSRFCESSEYVNPETWETQITQTLVSSLPRGMASLATVIFYC